MKCFRCPTEIAQVTTRFFDRGNTYALCEPCAIAARAYVTSTPTMTVEAMQTPFPIRSCGKSFKVMACGEQWHPSWWSFFDEVETREDWWKIQPGDVVADVGADFGSYTLPALANGAAKVYAWSPPFKHPTNPIECITLARSAELNGWTDRLQLFASGLWEFAGFLAAFDGPRAAQYHSTPNAALGAIAAQPGNCAAFQVGKLDSLNLPRLDWLKVDVEGAEPQVFSGG